MAVGAARVGGADLRVWPVVTRIELTWPPTKISAMRATTERTTAIAIAPRQQPRARPVPDPDWAGGAGVQDDGAVGTGAAGSGAGGRGGVGGADTGTAVGSGGGVGRTCCPGSIGSLTTQALVDVRPATSGLSAA